MEQHEQWTTEHRYLDMAAHWQGRQEHQDGQALLNERGNTMSLWQKAIGQ